MSCERLETWASPKPRHLDLVHLGGFISLAPMCPGLQFLKSRGPPDNFISMFLLGWVDEWGVVEMEWAPTL